MNTRKSSVKSVKNELIKKSREAMLAAAKYQGIGGSHEETENS